MATFAEWSVGYARQAAADFSTYEALQTLAIPECHKLQFLQMACEKLVKGYLCGQGTDPSTLQSSHAYVAGTLPVVLRQYAAFINFTGPTARSMMKHVKRLSQEIEVLAPAVKRSGHRRDNCEYPWSDGPGSSGTLHVPLDWSFTPSNLLVVPSGRTFLKLVRGAIAGLLP